MDTVVLTHLHTDHVGWAVVGGEHARPFFPNAEYLLQQAELDVIEAVNPQLRSTVIAPLQKTDQLRLLDGDTPPAQRRARGRHARSHSQAPERARHVRARAGRRHR